MTTPRKPLPKSLFPQNVRCMKLAALAAKKRRPCPFCGRGHNAIHPYPFRRLGSSLFQVPCECGATGPQARTWRDALNAWNRAVRGAK